MAASLGLSKSLSNGYTQAKARNGGRMRPSACGCVGAQHEDDLGGALSVVVHDSAVCTFLQFSRVSVSFQEEDKSQGLPAPGWWWMVVVVDAVFLNNAASQLSATALMWGVWSGALFSLAQEIYVSKSGNTMQLPCSWELCPCLGNDTCSVGSESLGRWN